MELIIVLSLIFFPFVANCQYECEDKLYHDTIYSGICEEFYPSGKVQFKTTFKLGQKNGTYQEFYEDGTLRAQANYSDWDLIGESIRYYSNGKVKARIVTDSVGNGNITRFFKNGKIQVQGTFTEGLRTGIWREFDIRGNIVSETIENEYEELFKMEKEAEERNKNSDQEKMIYVIDWSWTAEEEFFISEDWY